MPDLAVYNLAFHNGLHAGTAAVRADTSAVTFSAGTLFAAVLDVMRRTGLDPATIVAPFPRTEAGAAPIQGSDPPWLLTSAFPYAGAVRFFPMPVPVQAMFTAQTLRDRGKDIRGVRFISEGIFRQMLAGSLMDAWLYPSATSDGETKGVAIQGGTFWMAADEFDGLPTSIKPARGLRALSRRIVFRRTSVPRVTVTRAGSAGELYHVGRAAFAEGCGLWFGIHWRRPDDRTGRSGSTWRSVWEGALSALQDDGLGGERSAGYGAFKWSQGGTVTLPDARAGEAMILLSRYHPRPDEVTAALTGDRAAYELVSVGGWLRTWDGAAQRRRRLWMAEAGSVVGVTGWPQGSLVDVQPTYDNSAGAVPHPVWRWGLGLGARWGGGV